MVKPQPPFRRETAHAPDPDDSFGSYGQPVEHHPQFPDFAICTYSPSLKADTLHIVVEVKRDGESYVQACLDLFDYLDSQAGVMPNAFGIAIAGSNVGILEPHSASVAKYFDLADIELIGFLKKYSRDHDI
jgi:hypothetical protein